jgi:hypothetical protein
MNDRSIVTKEIKNLHEKVTPVLHRSDNAPAREPSNKNKLATDRLGWLHRIALRQRSAATVPKSLRKNEGRKET